jgi:hypothetical protein
MNTRTIHKSLYFIFAILFFLCLAPESYAIPSFARQTNMPCSSCHTMFPELNAFGRLFKMNAYNLVGSETIQIKDDSDNVTLNLLKVPPVSAMFMASYNYVAKPIPGTQNNDVSFPQQLSLFLGGQFTPRLGGFIQLTYDDQSGAIGLDNTEIRYSNQTELLEQSLIYGLTLNNNPTVQDVWNSVPAWQFPFASSSVAPTPGAATIIEGGLAQSVAGLGIYGFWNQLIYGEVSLYRSAQQGGAHPPDGSSSGIINNVAPYWRVYLQKQLDETQTIEVGTLGMFTELYPTGITGATNKYTDIGFDANYEKSFGMNVFNVHGSYIHESQDQLASFNNGEVQNQTEALNSFRIAASIYLHQMFGFTLGYFNLSGDKDLLKYTPADVTGSESGTPDSDGLIAEVNFMPWLNTKFTLQYVAYDKFNGSSSNYDGAGRNASDNNTLYLLSWIAF